MEEWLLKLPAYIGSIPQWGMFFVLLIAVVRTSPEWIKTWFDEAKAKRERVWDRVTKLEAELKECKEECDKRDELYTHYRLGAERQRVAEQISLVSLIVQSVDNPLLSQLLNQLERQQKSLPPVELPGVVGDVAK